LYYCSVSTGLVGHDYTACSRASQEPRYACLLLDNTWALLISHCSQMLLYSSLADSRGTRGDSVALQSREAGCRATGHVVTLVKVHLSPFWVLDE
jgi:hypothetical protein